MPQHLPRIPSRRRARTLALALALALGAGAAFAAPVAARSQPQPAAAAATPVTGQFHLRGKVYGPAEKLRDNVYIKAFDGHQSILASALSYGGAYDLYLDPGEYTIEYNAYDADIAVERVRVRVTGSQVLDAIHLRHVAVAPLAPPAVTGTARVGGALHASYGSWPDPGNLVFGYTWLRDGHAVPGAHRATYQPQPADAGRRLSVRVTASREHYVPATVTSAALSVSRAPVRITAVPKTLRARHGSPVSVLVRVVAPGGTATGRVALLDGARPLAGCTLVAGRCTATLRLPVAGRYPVLAAYAGSSAYQKATSDRFVLTATR